jgi:phosphoribosyl 1,2-cyclic phosphodiesterase
MKFTPLASSSRGNAYLLEAEGAAPLLLEAGIPIKRLREKLREHGVSLSELAGCLVSHCHGDHSKAVKEILLAGVDVWASHGTAEALAIFNHHRFHAVTQDIFQVEKWNVIGFDLEHDAPEPKGFIVSCGLDRILFVPDTSYVKNRFRGITLIAVECNNITETLNRNVIEGYIPPVVARRIRRNHMSLENLILMLKANDTSRLREVWLLHLSDANSSEDIMKQKIQEELGVPVYVAKT